MAHVVEAPPLTPSDPVTEVLHGVEIVDPYRWLEDQKSPATQKWIEEQTAYARSYLDAIPDREVIRGRVERASVRAVKFISRKRAVVLQDRRRN